MATGKNRRTPWAILVLTPVCLCCLPAHAKYGGGSGTVADPYQIWTAEQMNTIGAEPNDWDKHFKLMADIGLSAFDGKNGRPAFNIIAPHAGKLPWSGSFSDYPPFEGIPFTGVFDGGGHTISNFRCISTNPHYVGLFGYVEGADAEVKNLGLIDPLVEAEDAERVGALVGGIAGGTVTACYVEGGSVRGLRYTGGLVGENRYGRLALCYSTAAVSGEVVLGGLAGHNGGDLTRCYSTGKVRATGWAAGGLVGLNEGVVLQCYGAADVSGREHVGGLLGTSGYPGDATGSFYDVEKSGRPAGARSDGTGLTTAQMQDVRTYLDAGWDWVGESGNGTSEIWRMPEGGGYPVLAILSGHTPPRLQGAGTPDDPYLISSVQELGAMYYGNLRAHYRLVAPIDLSGIRWATAVIPRFAGTFDGNGLAISHLTVEGGERLGLFEELAGGAEIKDLGVTDVRIIGMNEYIGGLAGYNNGDVIRCHSTGVVGCVTGPDGRARVSAINIGRSIGGLIGNNNGHMVQCYSTVAVSGVGDIGGLVGRNSGNVSRCHSAGSVENVGGGEWSAFGGLAGQNTGTITHCYSASSVNSLAGYGGGLVGTNAFGAVTQCYSMGAVRGNERAGGLVGNNGWDGNVAQCFWDVQTSGQNVRPWSMGTGLTTARMWDSRTYLDAGWDWVDETENGTSEIWQMPKTGGYPLLAAFNGYTPPRLRGHGTMEAPYLISDAWELGAIIHHGRAAHYRLANSIDLSGICWGTAVIPELDGTFDGNDLTVSHLTIRGGSFLGLFGRLGFGADVKHLGIVDANVTGSGSHIGALVGYNWQGTGTQCYSTGVVRGFNEVGGLVGSNWGGVLTECHSSCAVRGNHRVGGLAGLSGGAITWCYATGKVNGKDTVGGLAGESWGNVLACFGTGTVGGTDRVGGLIGDNGGNVIYCRSISAVKGAGQCIGGLVGENSASGLVTNCYSMGPVVGHSHVGGLVGDNGYVYYSYGSMSWRREGTISHCFSAGNISGQEEVGGILGFNEFGTITFCLWDSQVSGLMGMCGAQDPDATGCDDGYGKTTAEMQMAGTFLEAGWDFVGETVNGTEDIWWILEGQDYPRLWWEAAEP